MTERMLADVQFLRAQDLLVRGDCMLPVEPATRYMYLDCMLPVELATRYMYLPSSWAIPGLTAAPMIRLVQY